MIKIKNVLLAAAALVSVTGATTASATSERREAILYNKAQKQAAIEQRRAVKEQYQNGDITRAEKKQQVQDLKDQIQDYGDNVDDLKASK